MANVAVIKEKLSQDNYRPLRIILIIVLSLIIAFLVYKIIRKVFLKPPNANYIPGGGDIPKGWSPTAITDELFDVIDGVTDWTEAKDAAYAKFNALNDNQKIAVYNNWIDQGYSQKSTWFGLGPSYGTLTKAVKDETGYIAFSGVNNMDVMIANLDRLQLK